MKPSGSAGTLGGSATRSSGSGVRRLDASKSVFEILYVARTGCACRKLPADFPPWETMYRHFTRWEPQRPTLQTVDATRARGREDAGPDSEPSAGPRGLAVATPPPPRPPPAGPPSPP
ncbi:transposase [Actinokineospora globicatena]|uniref:transposase n=1 Tax=Actinokineospora globicatena TaxID=103729 RepID=UPI003D7FE1A8